VRNTKCETVTNIQGIHVAKLRFNDHVHYNLPFS